jgi:hypothetical protein
MTRSPRPRQPGQVSNGGNKADSPISLQVIDRHLWQRPSSHLVTADVRPIGRARAASAAWWRHCRPAISPCRKVQAGPLGAMPRCQPALDQVAGGRRDPADQMPVRCPSGTDSGFLARPQAPRPAGFPSRRLPVILSLGEAAGYGRKSRPAGTFGPFH